jgi:molybdate transport system ATP-binding protein
MQVKIPTLLVTHDRIEAIALGDRMAVVAQGRIQQIGSVEEVFGRPANHVVASSVGVETVIPGEIAGVENGLLAVQTRQARIFAVDPGDLSGRDVYVCIRAEEVVLSKSLDSQGSARNRLVGVVTSIVPEGPLIRVSLDCGIPIVALITKPARDDMELKQGDSIIAVVKATSVHIVPRSADPG